VGTHAWDFAGIGTSTLTNPSFDFLLPGDYDVVHTVENNCDTESKTQTVTITLPSAPDPTFQHTLGSCQTHTVQFTSTQSGNHHWDFGDGSTPSTLQSPSHNFPSAGMYTVIHTVSEPICGIQDISTQVITVNFCGGEANFTGGQTECNNNISFNCTENNQTWTHAWTIAGNPTSFNTCSFNATLGSAPFLLEGDYNIIHTITAPGGLTLSANQTIGFYHLDFTDPTITSNTTWAAGFSGNFVLISGTLTINPNVSLTIAKEVTVMFCGADSRLVIKQGDSTTPQGGKLTLRGTLTDFQSKTWQGVEVRGNGQLPQMINIQAGTSRQGQLICTGTSSVKASIRNAGVAIRNFNSTTPGQSGGVIRCEHTTFVNNGRAAQFNRYPATPITSTVNYRAKFKNCTFEVNDMYTSAVLGNFRSFLFLTQVRNVEIESSHFRNYLPVSVSNPTILSWGAGIEASSASFRINSPTNVVSGTVIPRCTFSGLGYGVWAYTKDTPTAPFVANLSDFNNCIVGIRNQGITGSTLLYNDFNMGTLPANAPNTFVQAGMVFEGRMDINACQENEFINNNATATHPIVGINCHNVGYSENLIRKNTFTEMTTGNMAIGLNGNGDAAFPEGLAYLCNTNLNVAGFDIDVAQEDGTTALSSIRLTQGLGADPAARAAGNIFSEAASITPPSGIFNSNAGAVIKYWFDDDVANPGNVAPSFAPIGSVLPEDKSENTCPVEYCEPPCSSDGVINGLKTGYYAAKAALPQLQVNYATKPSQENAQALAQARQQMEFNSRMVLLHVMYDTLNYHPDTVYTWVGNRGNVSAELSLSDLKLASGNTTAALAILDQISTKYSLSQSQAADIQSYRNATNLLVGQNLDALSATTITALSNYTQAGGQTEAFVKRLLTHNGQYFAPEFVFSQLGAGGNDDKSNADLDLVKTYVVAAPNPAKDFVNFRFYLEENTDSAELVVLDINGKLLLWEKVAAGLSSLEWNTDQLPSGIYFYQLKTARGILQSGKVVLSK
jgi:PKD repeat protein